MCVYVYLEKQVGIGKIAQILVKGILAAPNTLRLQIIIKFIDTEKTCGIIQQVSDHITKRDDVGYLIALYNITQDDYV